MAGLAKKKMSEVEGLANVIGIMFMSRTYAHMAHLKTGSFAKHKALNEFYDSVVDKADALAEAAQGKYGRLDIPFKNMDGNVNDPISALTSHLRMIEMEAKLCSTPFLDNIVQEIQALYSSTLYLLAELS